MLRIIFSLCFFTVLKGKCLRWEGGRWGKGLQPVPLWGGGQVLFLSHRKDFSPIKQAMQDALLLHPCRALCAALGGHPRRSSTSQGQSVPAVAFQQPRIQTETLSFPEHILPRVTPPPAPTTCQLPPGLRCGTCTLGVGYVLKYALLLLLVNELVHRR